MEDAQKFPACFPENFEKDILPQGATNTDRKAFRVIKFGRTPKSFLSTYEEVQQGLMVRRTPLDKNDPKTYGTSCAGDIKDVKKVLKLIMRHKPRAFIADGTIAGSCGPSQLTSERNPEEKTSHIDWWVYENSNPQDYFNIPEQEEQEELQR